MTSTRDFTDTDSAQQSELDRLRAEVAEWRRRYEKGELRDIGFLNSESEVEPLYTALDVSAESVAALGVPGTYPFTRGVHPTGYRGKLRTMRQFAGFGGERHERAIRSARARTNRLSTAFDFLTLGAATRPSALARRSRQDRRRHLEPRRHEVLPTASPRQSVDVDDDQRPRDHRLGVLHRGGRAPRCVIRKTARHDSE